MSLDQATDPGPSRSVSMDATLAGHEQEPTPARDREALHAQQIGRYTVLGRLGAGAMGVVLAAYDPELDRKIALKLLHPHERLRRAHDGHLRLLAEAQALARLSDPNVVTVHDVGTHEGCVFVAMEFVEGQTLEAWLDQGPHAWTEVLDVMLPAGRGLAVAHAHDLVHRDFKPANVMLGHDGRVRVMDFGLARAAEGETEASFGEPETSQPRQRALELMLTQQGTLIGTPAYMAPEQFMGSRGGAAGDQFSFCVTLWEALYGQRPFAGESVAELCTSVLGRTIVQPPARPGVPRWLRRVVERGLAVDPDLRWPSMRALLHALSRGRSRARARRWLVVGAVAIAAGLGGWGLHRYDRLQRQRACEAEGASIDQVWNDEVAAATHTALVATGLPHAETTAQKVRPWLDAQAEAWQAARTAACVRTEVEGQWDATLYERARWCLYDRRMELEALVTALGRAGPAMVNEAVSSASRLAQVQPCLDAQGLTRTPTPSAEMREEVRARWAELSQSRVLRWMGAYDEALAQGRSTLEQAEALGWSPLTAAVRLEVGLLLLAQGAYDAAREELETAYFQAARSGTFDVAATAATELIKALGYRLARYDQALDWSRHAELMSALSSGDGDLHEADRLQKLAAVYYSKGDYEQATAASEQALRIDEEVFGPHHPKVTDILNNLASVEHAQGHYDRARALFQRNLDYQRAILGPDHPALVGTLHNLAMAHQSLKEFEQATRTSEQALHLAEQSYRSDHPVVADCLAGLADILRTRAHAALEREEFEQARALFERAAQSFERALRLEEAILDPDHPGLAYPLHGLADIALAQGRFDEAVSLAQRALRVREQGGIGSDLIAEARFLLAQAQWELGEDRAGAIATAQQALREFREHGEARAWWTNAVQEWLDAHPQPPPQ